jgi:hypothetical protein
MQNVLALAPAIAQTSSFGSSAGKGRSGLVDARDVAAVAAEIAAAPAGHAGRTYRVTGPELAGVALPADRVLADRCGARAARPCQQVSRCVAVSRSRRAARSAEV